MSETLFPSNADGDVFFLDIPIYITRPKYQANFRASKKVNTQGKSARQSKGRICLKSCLRQTR
jgi:hypothetical protein